MDLRRLKNLIKKHLKTRYCFLEVRGKEGKFSPTKKNMPVGTKRFNLIIVNKKMWKMHFEVSTLLIKL